VIYRLLADAVLLVHTAFIAFVLFGLIAIVAGWWRGWAWVRNGWFRAATWRPSRTSSPRRGTGWSAR
jgi:hypothetical protein